MADVGLAQDEHTGEVILLTDARLPGEWLNTPQFDDLSDVAWRVFTSSLMWSAENGTDGHIPIRYLKFLHPEGEQPDAHRHLVAAGLWTQESAGYFMPNWSTSLHQSTAAEVEAYKTSARQRQQKWRDRQRERLMRQVGFTTAPGDTAPAVATRDVTRDVMRDVTGDVTCDVTSPATGYVGKAKAKAKASNDGVTTDNAVSDTEPAPTAEVAKPPLSWSTAAIPKGAAVASIDTPPFPKCAVCHQMAKSLDAWGLCSKTTGPHVLARRAVA